MIGEKSKKESKRRYLACARRGLSGLKWAVLLMALAVLSACSFETRGAQVQACSEDYACPIGEVCVEGFCEADGLGDVSLVDAGRDATDEGDARDIGDGGEISDAADVRDGGDASDARDAADTGHDAGSDAAPADTDPSDTDPSDTDPSDTDPSDTDPSDTDPGPCLDGQTRACGIDEGECSEGIQTCVNGAWGACNGGVDPTNEVCDGKDNDCDGQIDNDPARVGEDCSTGGVGACDQGQLACNAGQLECEQTVFATTEICNSIDDDCDNEVDEEIAEVGDSCQTGQPGICDDGEKHCEFGQIVCKRIRGPITEVCDGLDNDCDGSLDETFAQQGDACQTGELGQCADGSKQCVGAQVSCEPLNPASAETCDGVDNDCDGLLDEDPSGVALTTSCGAATCPGRGVSLCIGAQWTSCRQGRFEMCDGVDSNCDSQTDNPTPCYAVCPGGDVAVGTLDCSGTSGTCELPQEICNDGTDNDCDGQIDENCQNGNDRDGMVFVPGGPFWMGSQSTSFGFQQDESPLHLVELDPFYMDRAEVTRRQYRACVTATECSLPEWGCPYMGAGSTDNRLEKPIGCMTYGQAQEYCQWVGKRLPTAAEWEKAARGPYPRLNIFPWGNTQDASLAVVDCPDGLNDCSAESLSYPQGASYYGALHMAGNVAEWVTDYYDPNFYTSGYFVAPEQTTDQGYGHEVRGGSYDQTLQYARVSNRAALSFPTVDEDAVGFRCVMDAP